MTTPTSLNVPTRRASKRGYGAWSVRTVVIQLSRKLRATYRIRGERCLSQLLASLLAGMSTWALADLPTGLNVVAGQATASMPTANSMRIHQATDKAVMNWQTFNIGAAQSVQFVQPATTSVALNRIVGNEASSIYGSLSANGQVFLVNPSGVMFAPGAQVNVGGLVASSLAMGNEDFMAGRYTFSGQGSGAVSNHGTINAARGGYVLLAASQVSNTGSISAEQGAIGLVAGSRVTLDPSGSGLVRFSVDAAAANAAITNSGSIAANGGQVAVLASSVGDALATVINQTGVIRADSAVERNGMIVLSGGAGGVVSVTGKLVARGAGAGRTGGMVSVLGDKVGLSENALIDVTGNSGGGIALIGGNYLGKGEEQNASAVFVGANTRINADAVAQGNGGKVIVWANETTRFTGSISARSGSVGGNGGFVETSGKEYLLATGTVDASAANGEAGVWLLDPRNVDIVNAATAGGAFNAAEVFTPTADNARVDRNTVQNSLNNGTNVTITTGSDGSQIGNITIVDSITKTTGAAASLTLNAAGSILVNNSVTSSSNALSVNLNATTATTFSSAGSLTTNGGDVSINGTGAKTLGTLNTTGTAGTGNLTISSSGPISQIAALTIKGATTIAAGEANNVALGNTNNDFIGTVSVTSGRNVTLRETNNLILGNSAVSNNLNITTNGALTQSSGQTLTVTGTTTLAAGVANNITLNNEGNNFMGAMSVTSGKDVTLRDDNVLALGASAVSGTLGITAGGTVTQTGAVNAAQLTATLSGGGALNLGTQTNNIAQLNAITTPGGFTLTNGNNAVAINAAITSANSDVSITTGSGATTFGTSGSIASGGGNVTLTNTHALKVLGTINTTGGTGEGNFAITGEGVISQLDSTALSIKGATTLAAGAANNVTLDNTNNNFTGAVSVTSGNNVTLRGTNALVLDASVVSGNLNITTTGELTQTGTLNVTGATSLTVGAANDINLTNEGNDFIGAVSVTSGNNVSLTDTNALVLGASVVSGNLNITTTRELTQTGALNVSGETYLTAGAAYNITLNNADNNFTGAVSVTSGKDVTLRDKNDLVLGASVVSGNLNITTTGELTQTEALNVTGATSLTVGAANDINLTNEGNDFTGAVSVTSGNNVSLTDTNALVLGASSVSGNLNLTATGALTQTGALNVTGETSLIAGADYNITLNNADNNFTGAVSVTSSNNVSLTDANALVLGASLVSGNLNITTTGVLTQSSGQTLTVTGTTALAAGAAYNITLDNAGNNFTGAVSVTSGKDVTLRDKNDLVLGASAVSGNLNITTNGALTQTGALKVTGETSVTASNITLDNAGNNFTGAVSVTSGNVSLTDTDVLVLGASVVNGNLNITTTGALTQSSGQTLRVTGTTALAAGAAYNITLDNAGNNFTGAVSVTSGKDVTLRDTNALVLGASVVSGNLNITTTGALTQTGALNVTGATSLTAGAANNITLTNDGNDFTGAVSVTSGKDVTLRDKNDLVLGASVVSGNLNITTTGVLTQSSDQTLAVTGTTTLAADAAYNITLTNADNDFVRAVLVTSGNNVTLRDKNALVLGASAVSGNLNITTTGALTQVAARTLTVTGTTTLAAGAANNITLNNVGNNFTGAVSVTSGNNVTLRDNNDLVLGASTISNALTVTAGGTVTQTGAVSAAELTATLTGTSSALNLGTQTNNIAQLNAITALGGFTLNNGNNSVIVAGNITATNNAVFIDAGTGGYTQNTDIDISAGSGNITVVADTVAIAANTDNNALTTSGTLALKPKTAGQAMSLAGSSAFDLSADEITAISQGANSFMIGDAASTGVLTIGGAVSLDEKSLTLNAGSITDTGVKTITATNVTLNANGQIGASNTNGIDIAATNLSVNTSNANAFVRTGAINMGVGTNGSNLGTDTLDLTATGAVTQTASTGNITAGTLNVKTLGVGGAAITLTNTGNDAGTVNLQALDGAGAANANAAISYTDTNGFTISGINNGEGTSAGTVTLRAGGALTQTGAIKASTLTATTANNDGAAITLTNTGNDAAKVNLQALNGAGAANANAAISYTDATGFEITGINNGEGGIAGNVTLAAGGAVTQTGAIAATGLALTGTGGAYTLHHVNNAITTLAANTSSVSYKQTGALAVGTVGAVSGVTTTGTTQIETTGAAANLTLNNAVTSGATGNAIILKAGSTNAAGVSTGGQLINSVGAGGIVASSGRYLAYSGNPDNTTEGVTGYAKRYNANATVVPSGTASTFIYRIAPSLTVTANAGSKTYDGAAPTLTFGTTGLIDGDTAGTALTGALTRTGGKNVLGGDAVTIGTLAAQMGYGLTYAGANYTITAKSASVNATATNTTYSGQTQTQTAADTSGFIAGDNITVSGLASGKDASTYASNLAVGGTAASNYSVTINNANLVIGRANLTEVTASKTYDGLSTVKAQEMGVIKGVNGESFTASAGTAAISDKNVATASKTLTDLSGLTLTGGNDSTKTSNYNLASGLPVASDNKVTITAKTLTANVSASDKAYDGTTTATATLGIATGLVGQETVTATGAATFNSKNVATANLVTVNSATLADGENGGRASNYSLAAGQTANANITRASIANVSGITAANKSEDGTSAATLSTGNAVFNGKVAGDALTVATATGVFDTPAPGTGKSVSISGITLGGIDAGNYKLVNTTASTTASITAITTENILRGALTAASTAALIAGNRQLDRDQRCSMTSGGGSNGAASGNTQTLSSDQSCN